jgi:hypothetical protein
MPFSKSINAVLYYRNTVFPYHAASLRFSSQELIPAIGSPFGADFKPNGVKSTANASVW